MRNSKFITSLLAVAVTLFGFPACNLPFFGGESSNSSNNSGDSVSVSSENSAWQNSSESSVDSSSDSSDGSSTDSSDGGSVEVVNDSLSIHFMYFGNAISGDSTLIKVGNTEVLIDAGSTRGSADVIVPYIKEYCKDGVLEYVIATHAHSDHIAAFVGDEETVGVFDSFECGTIIDYTGQKTTSQVSKDYKAKRDAEVAAGATHYTALECWKEINGASRTYELGESVTLNILYQKYYEQSTSNENNYSVCVMISQGDNHYLFTGDLEEGGEKSLVENNQLPKCKVFKGGHHGSKTSNTNDLLSVIQPEIVCVCSCCGDANDFIHQEFIDTVAKYTRRVYVTTFKKADKTGAALNGNIVVTSDGKTIEVNCSNNNLLFMETEWFKENRTCPIEWK